MDIFRVRNLCLKMLKAIESRDIEHDAMTTLMCFQYGKSCKHKQYHTSRLFLGPAVYIVKVLYDDSHGRNRLRAARTNKCASVRKKPNMKLRGLAVC